MLNNLGSTRSVKKKNNWLDNECVDDGKHTDDMDEKQCSQVESQESDQTLNDSHSNKPIYSDKRYLYSKEESKEITKAIANININKKELDKIKGFEAVYRIPMRSYMWDILSLLRTNNRIKSQNIDLYLKWLPCGGSTFKNYFRFGTDNSPFVKEKKISTPQQIKSLLNCAKQEYRKDLLPIPLPKELNYKINGIWEMDVRIFRAINFNINRLELKNIECEMHISIWSHGPKKNNNKYDDEKKNDDDNNNDNDSDDEDEDDEEIEYDELDDEKDANHEILKIIEHCSNINIEDVMNHNKNKNVIKCVTRLTETNGDEHKNNNQDDTNLDDAEYEKIETFIDRICENEACPESGDSVMMLFDTRNAPKVSVYIWREKINRNTYKKNINIGDNRIHSKTNKKRRCFEFNAPNNRDKKINIGQYIGMDICMLESSVHQFWTIFNAETRFETDHALSLWRDYYVNETIFEVSSKLDDEYDEYKENDIEKRKLYETYYSKQFIEKLNDRTAILTEKELVLQKEKLIYSKDNKMPDLNKYKPFKFHWRRAQYVKYYGKSFISKLNDKTSKFDKDKLWSKKQEGLSNEKAPQLDKYGPFKFHWKRTENVDNFERELTEYRPIINLSPMEFKQFYSDATNHSDWNDKS